MAADVRWVELELRPRLDLGHKELPRAVHDEVDAVYGGARPRLRLGAAVDRLRGDLERARE